MESGLHSYLSNHMGAVQFFLEQDFHRKRKVQIPRKIFLIHNLRSADAAGMVIDIIGTIIYAFSAG